MSANNDIQAIQLTNVQLIQYVSFMLYSLNTIIGPVIGVLGIIGNIINIIIFHRHGFQHAMNITLTALSVSDILALLTLRVYNILWNPWTDYSNVDYVAGDLITMLSTHPHNYCVRVCGYVTAFASFEKCLSVLAPLKVKQIITKKVAIVTNVVIFVSMLMTLFPAYYVYYLDRKFSPKLNRTILQMNFRDFRQAVLSVSYFITDLAVPFLSFLSIIACNIALAIAVKRNVSWRNSLSTKDISKTKTLSKKETKLVLMLLIMSVVFLVCLIPKSALLTASSIDRSLGLGGSHFYIGEMIFGLTLYTESVNSSVNILIYYKMSSRYRTSLHEIWTQATERLHCFRSKDNLHDI
ncbi:probable G-protein coupled receptor frpr-1 [Physella acuta]|uniref:probable G-protein coupled receptor frpr-1 n=1 Tax=Physella acuta TaxID=109671 RepID=UPI0027DB2B78|nr:probable G-protein coupled receptor frpr-1 [Physella acuta]